MKGNSLLVILALLIAVASLCVMGLAGWHILLTRDLNRTQFMISQFELRQNRLRALVNECAEYGKRNAAIHPLLQSIGVKITPSASTDTPPAANR